jgi:hypothetical protein
MGGRGGGFTVWLANFEWRIQFLKIPPNLIARSKHVYKLSSDVHDVISFVDCLYCYWWLLMTRQPFDRQLCFHGHFLIILLIKIKKLIVLSGELIVIHTRFYTIQTAPKFYFIDYFWSCKCMSIYLGSF